MRLARRRKERLWQGWSGQGELGASTSSGNDESEGVTAGLQIAKEELNWQHKFDALVDYRRTSGVTEKERLNPSRSEEHTSELQSLMRIPYAGCWLETKTNTQIRACTSCI